MKYSPHEYQNYAINYIETHPIATVFLDMGLGKTSITLTAINDLLFDSFDVHRVLVIAPLRVARDTWTAEVDKWDHLQNLICSVAVGTADERKAALMRPADIYNAYPFDGKYIIDNGRIIICQSNAEAEELRRQYATAEINPLGDWAGGTDVDTGATNRKLGSDMADSVTGGGLHGKDLSKADVSVNIYAWLEAQRTGKPVELCCAIGDETVGGILYEKIVETAREYICSVGGFEAFAEWGLVC